MGVAFVSVELSRSVPAPQSRHGSVSFITGRGESPDFSLSPRWQTRRASTRNCRQRARSGRRSRPRPLPQFVPACNLYARRYRHSDTHPEREAAVSVQSRDVQPQALWRYTGIPGNALHVIIWSTPTSDIRSWHALQKRDTFQQRLLRTPYHHIFSAHISIRSQNSSQ